MTALAADKAVSSRQASGHDIRSYLVEDNVKIFKGGLCVIDSSGYLRPARNTAGEVVVGVAYEQVDNTLSGHAAGGKSCRVLSEGHFLLTTAGAAQAWVGTAVYALDDGTVRQTVGTGNFVGIVTEYVSATQVWVFIPTPSSNALLLGAPGQATAAGGGAAGALFGAAAIGFYWGSGAPTISAAKGSIYSRTDGSSTSTRLYVNTDGATTWTNVTTAA